MFIFLYCVCIEFLYVYFPVLLCLSVSVKWLAVKTASEMTYTVSGGALNSAQPQHQQPLWAVNGPHKCNTTAIQVFLPLLQVACKFSASCRKLVLQRCIAGICTSAITTAIQEKKFVVLLLYCSCIALVRTALGGYQRALYESWDY